MVPVRVLVAIELNMHREVLAFHIRQQRPHSEVFLASPETLEDEAKRGRPHLSSPTRFHPYSRRWASSGRHYARMRDSSQTSALTSTPSPSRMFPWRTYLRSWTGPSRNSLVQSTRGEESPGKTLGRG